MVSKRLTDLPLQNFVADKGADRLPFTPVVIIGAGRSGTNMLRDTLTALEGVATWPCDEINPIWRHGNIAWPNDEIPVERAARPRAFIRRAFRRIWRQTGECAFVVEKTCANSLRVPFVDAVLPEARYIHIIRDGVDVVASAQKRWRGEMEIASLPYYWAKIRYTPIVDLPVYGLAFVKNRIAMGRSMEKRMHIWGPRFAGMEAMKGASLDAVCAQQWVECVTRASNDLATVAPGRHITLHYEDVATNPANCLRRIVDFLGYEASDEALVAAAAPISRRSVGKGRKALSGDAAMLMEILGPALAQHGYEDKEMIARDVEPVAENCNV